MSGYFQMFFVLQLTHGAQGLKRFNLVIKLWTHNLFGISDDISPQGDPFLYRSLKTKDHHSSGKF